MLGSDQKRCLVISAVNFTEGGPLTILRDAVSAAAREHPSWTVNVLVHRLGLLNIPGVVETAFPRAKSSWLRRLGYEWFGFHRLSRELKPDVWLSLHDITPRVQAGRRYVYCHNPAPFARLPWRTRLRDRSFLLFTLFYGLLYRLNIGANTAVIVQQQWLRKEFMQRYGAKRVVVAYPSVAMPSSAPGKSGQHEPPQHFVYPTFPRVFKNVEMLGQCVEVLEREHAWSGQIAVTLDGSESSYARSLVDRWGHLKSLRFIGLQRADAMQQLYADSDALIFPSLLETWGLPLSEAKVHGLPILVADLPYAHETVGNCEAVCFFDPLDPEALAELLVQLSTGLRGFGRAVHQLPDAPCTQGWSALMRMLLVEDESPMAHHGAPQALRKQVP